LYTWRINDSCGLWHPSFAEVLWPAKGYFGWNKEWGLAFLGQATPIPLVSAGANWQAHASIYRDRNGKETKK